MLKIAKADKDTYVTNKIVKGKMKSESNVGSAGTLDLFKLYGANFAGPIPVTELSRILIHFDLDAVKSLVEEGRIDTNDPSFYCKIHLRDVYGGQPTPANFTVSVFPLSASFDEGLGKDVVYYSDRDTSNWLTSSIGNPWFSEGCDLACDAQTSQGDYITSSLSLNSTEVTQTFKKGSEDLLVDVTPLISATLSGELPDSGFRISFHNSLEDNSQTYFVKRFASRDAYETAVRPKLIVGYDDSVTDDSQNMTFDSECNLSLYNYVKDDLSNIVSGSSLTPIVGDDCIVLKLVTAVSGGNYDLTFSGSQMVVGSNYVTGSYEVSVLVPSSDPVISAKISQSGSVDFTPVWSSADLSVAYLTGSILTVRQPTRTSSLSPRNFYVTTQSMKISYSSDSSEETVRVNVFDRSNPYVKLRRLPFETPGIVVKDAYYQIRDAVTNYAVIPFDDVKNSTKMSSDSSGMFFKFDPTNLEIGRTYVVDAMLHDRGAKQTFMNISPVFRIEANEEKK